MKSTIVKYVSMVLTAW